MSSPLSKQKHRISLLFSLSILAIIVVLDIGFLSYKYFDYERQEIDRLVFQAQGMSKILSENPMFGQDLLQGKGLTMPVMNRKNGNGINPGGPGRSERRGIQMENFFVYNLQDKTILFSPQKDNETYTAILGELESRLQSQKTSFHLNDTDYFFFKTPLTKNIGAVFFTESRMTDESILLDIIMYLSGALLLSFIVYIISSRFVESTLSPVEVSMEQMEQFVHNAGHELKTPIAVIKSSLELMRLKKNYDEGITESIGELWRMDNLIQALISLSNLGESSETEIVDITEVCEKLSKHYGEKLTEKRIEVEILTKKPLIIKANREYTEILIANVLSNAIKYNKEGGKITITIAHKSLIIQDTGIGISPENLGKVFDRFYREDENRVTDSFGIGLSLVNRIVELYGWKIHLESEKWKGTTIKILF